MKERPILFKQPHADEMVRAILDGTKTQLRVPVKPQPPYDIEYPPEGRDGWFCSAVLGAKDYGHGLEWTVGASWGSQPCPKRWLHLLPKLAPPLGTVGDRLWVRETFADQHPLAIQDGRYSQPGRAGIPGPPPVEYRTIYSVDGEPNQIWRNGTGLHPYFEIKEPSEEDLEFATIRSNYTKSGRAVHWIPSIHMPRWASRIDLEITRVWVERVQDITEEDAKAEGVIPDDYEGCEHPDNPTLSCAAHRYSFRDLWQSIYGTWDANPFVWAYEFRRVKP